MVRVLFPTGDIPITGMTPNICSFKALSGYPAVQVAVFSGESTLGRYEMYDKDEIGIFQQCGTVTYGQNFKEHGISHVQLSGSVKIWNQLNKAEKYTTPVNSTQFVPVHFVNGVPCVPISVLPSIRQKVGYATTTYRVISDEPDDIRVVKFTHNADPAKVKSLSITFFYGRTAKMSTTGKPKLIVTAYSVGISGTVRNTAVNSQIYAWFASQTDSFKKEMEEYHQTFKFSVNAAECWEHNIAFWNANYTPMDATTIGSIRIDDYPTRQELYDKYIKAMYNTMARYTKYDILFGFPFQENLELLANQALTDATYIDTNLFAFAKDIPSSFGEIAAAKAAAKSLKASDFASLYLGTTYGTQLTEQDTFTIFDGVRKYVSDKAWKRQLRTCRARAHMTAINEPISYASVDITLTYKLVYNPFAGSGCGALYNFGEELGLVLDWNNVWDLIPYSFVADWCVNIQDLCVAADNQKFMKNCKIIAEVIGRKFEYPLILPSGCVGNIVIKCYKRTVSPSATVTPRDDLVTGSITGQNVAIGSSLIIQRLHK